MKEIVCYTADEAAKILKMGKSTLYTYIRSGQIKAVKIGRKYRIMESEIQRLLQLPANDE